MREKALLRAGAQGPQAPGDIDPAEAQVAAEYAENVNRVREKLHADVTNATARILKLGARLDTARAEEAGVRARLEIANARAEHRDDMIAAEREVMAAERDLRLFRVRNNLSREPSIPRDQVISGAWLAILLVLEAAFNTPFFLIEGQSFVGAVFEGLLVSGANIGLGLMAGMVGLRLSAHKRLFPWKLCGAVTFIGATTGAVSLALLMALRRIHASEPAQAGALVGDLSPIVLTVAFTAFAALGFMFAAYKGWQGFFEPYPGYGQSAKRLANARRRLEDLRHDFHVAARQAIQDVQQDLEDEIDADRDAVASARLINTEVDAAELAAKSSLTDLRQRADYLIKVYRETTAEVDGRPGPLPLPDIDPMLQAENPTAERARKALEESERKLAQNETAYATGLAELRQVLLGLENDLAMSVTEAQAAARNQRKAEIDAEEAPRPPTPPLPEVPPLPESDAEATTTPSGKPTKNGGSGARRRG